eukprot:3793017-Rhodomonas_salina.1
MADGRRRTNEEEGRVIFERGGAVGLIFAKERSRTWSLCFMTAQPAVAAPLPMHHMCSWYNAKPPSVPGKR